MKKKFWNHLKRITAGVMAAALLFTAGYQGSREPMASTCEEEETQPHRT